MQARMPRKDRKPVKVQPREVSSTPRDLFGVGAAPALVRLKREASKRPGAFSLSPCPTEEPTTFEDHLRHDLVQGLSAQAFRAFVYLFHGIPLPARLGGTAVLKELSDYGFEVPLIERTQPTSYGELTGVRTRSGRFMPKEWLARFDRFYELYGHDKNRIGALTAWYKLEEDNLKRPVDFDLINEGAIKAARQAANYPSDKRKFAEGWITDRRWMDSYDDGTYDSQALQLIEYFNTLCPKALRVVEYAPIRAEAIRAALVRLPLDLWHQYFIFLSKVPELVAGFKHGVSIQAALSPEMVAQARERLHSINAAANLQTAATL